MKQYAAKALLALALANSPAISYAQEPSVTQSAQKTEEKNQNNPESKVKASGLGLNTTQYNDCFSTSSASLTFLEFPKSELWFVGGQDYNCNTDQNDFDVGLKYLKNRNLFRGTLVASKDKQGRQKISGGIDWDAVLASYKDVDISLLGDISSVDKGNRHTDFGIGTKLTLSKNHNAFFLYSNRGENKDSSYRIGYMFLDKKNLASIVADYTENKKPAFTGFLGLPDYRFILSYNPNSDVVSSNNILSFGNEPLPYYARAVFPANQLILTQRSISDSDANHFFQSPFFLSPKRKLSDVVRLNFSYDTKNGKLENLLFYNALLIRTKGKQGIVLTQNANRSNGDTFYGGGIGYRFGRITPVVIFQTGDKRRVTFDLNFSY